MTKEALKMGLQDDSMRQMKSNYKKDQHSIDGFALQSKTAWFGGVYLQAGQLAGVVNTYLFHI